MTTAVDELGAARGLLLDVLRARAGHIEMKVARIADRRHALGAAGASGAAAESSLAADSDASLPGPDEGRPSRTAGSDALLLELAGVEIDPDVPLRAPKLFRCTDLGNAERLVHHQGHDLRHVEEWGWLVWTGTHWARRPGAAEVLRRSKDVVRSMMRELEAVAVDEEDEELRALERSQVAKELGKWQAKSESERAMNAMARLASAFLEARPPDFDVDPWALNVRNGTIDLRTGILRPHRRDDLLTHLAPVDYTPGAACPRWLAFVRWMACDEDDLVTYLQTLAGYCSTADTTAQVFPIFHGAGANGKSTFFEVLRHILGDYAAAAPQGFVMARSGEEHPTSIAGLAGKRLVVASETSESNQIDEARVKALTGDEQIRARLMGKDFFDFMPTFKVPLLTNPKPTIVGTDHGIWRRIHFVPCRAKATEPDPDLKHKLLTEAEGILAWMVEGAVRMAQTRRLTVSDSMATAKVAYQSEMDTLGSWIEERCLVAPGATCETGKLYASYRSFVQDRGEHPWAMRRFTMRLAERGFDPYKGAQGSRRWKGLELRQTGPEAGFF